MVSGQWPSHRAGDDQHRVSCSLIPVLCSLLFVVSPVACCLLSVVSESAINPILCESCGSLFSAPKRNLHPESLLNQA